MIVMPGARRCEPHRLWYTGTCPDCADGERGAGAVGDGGAGRREERGMSEQARTDDLDHPSVDSFANHVLIDWDSAMHSFFNEVDRKRRARDLTGRQVREALNRGYGHEVGDQWDEWYGDGDSDDD